MKFVFFTGGAAGFTLAAATDYFSGRNPDRILWDGAVGCLIGAFLLRWFWGVLLRGVRETYIARHLAATAAAAAAAESASRPLLAPPPASLQGAAAKPRL